MNFLIGPHDHLVWPPAPLSLKITLEKKGTMGYLYLNERIGLLGQRVPPNPAFLVQGLRRLDRVS